MSVYLITVRWSPTLVWVEFASSVQQALKRVRARTQRQGILDRDLRCQEWSSLTDLRAILDTVWDSMDPEQRIHVLLSTAESILTTQTTIAKTMSRLTDYLSLQATINNIERGEI